MPFNALAEHRPPSKACDERNLNPSLSMASAYRRATDECAVPPLGIEARTIQLSPYRAGVAGLYHTRLLTPPASPPCSCPLSFQNQVRRVASKSSALNFAPLRGRFTPCVPWRTLSHHPAPQYPDACHAYLAGDSLCTPVFSRRGNVHGALVDCCSANCVDRH
jgi:hypothetical protein